MPVFSYGQGNEQFYSELAKAMGSGNTTLLTGLLHEEIDISSNGKESSYSKEQARVMFLEFFQQNRPVTFSLKHKGASADGQVYMIGKLETTSGQNFKIVCRAKNNNAGYRVFKLDLTDSY